MIGLLDAFSFLGQSDFWMTVGILAAVSGIAGLGVQLNVGTTGIMNFGPAGFMGIGVYTMAILTVKAGWSLWLGLVAGVAFAVVAAVLVSLPALRLRADYFAIVTLAFAEVVRYLIVNQRSLTQGDQGIIGFDSAWRKASSSISMWLESVGVHGGYLMPLLVVGWVSFLALMLLLSVLVRSPWGRVLNAIRADEDVARALGKNTQLYKLQSLAIAAALFAISGYFIAFNLALVVPEMFDASVTIFAYTLVILGGLRSYIGVAVGSIVLFVILEGTRYVDVPLDPAQVAALRYIIVGLLLIGIIAFRPQGILGKRDGAAQ